MEALELANSLKLNDWCLAAGFVRNLVWDKLHGYEVPTPLNDIDLIYFDKDNIDPETDKYYERKLKEIAVLPWSVKNQARMHKKNEDNPYSSSADAMSYWVEIQAAIGANISKDGEVSLVAPFGLEAFFNNSITINQKRLKEAEFERRIAEKGWLDLWPNLKVHGPTYCGS